MSIITLLTDFGVEDAYVGIMKGVILSINPRALIVDITHHIDPHDVLLAAYTIKSSYRFFPSETVHVVVVDPGVGGRRSIVAVAMQNQIFLAPDNGVLSLVLDDGEIDTIVRVENSKYFLEPVSRTFHGRDIFAPICAHLSNGLEIKELGPSLDRKDLVRLDIKPPHISDRNELTGVIISVDRFGNCVTNIDESCLRKLSQNIPQKDLFIRIGKNTIHGLSQSYDSVGPQQPLAIIGSLGYVEIAINCGNAARFFQVARKDDVRITLPDACANGSALPVNRVRQRPTP